MKKPSIECISVDMLRVVRDGVWGSIRVVVKSHNWSTAKTRDWDYIWEEVLINMSTIVWGGVNLINQMSE